MTYKKIHMTFNIKRHMHARAIFRWYSDPFSSTTPAAAGIDNPGCLKWRETLPSQEESSGRDILMGQLVTKVLVSRESPCRPASIGLAVIAPSRGI